MLDFETLKRWIFLLLFLYELKFNYSAVKLKRVLLVNLLSTVKLLNFLLAVYHRSNQSADQPYENCIRSERTIILKISIENIVSRCIPISKLILVRSRKYIYFDQRIQTYDLVFSWKKMSQLMSRRIKFAMPKHESIFRFPPPCVLALVFVQL